MDEFSFDRPELSGALVSMEFGAGGRIQRLWVADPNLPEEGEEFQFVLAPLGFGEEFSEDYYPGTILIGARGNAGEPWVLSRNAEAEVIEDEPTSIGFRYDLSLLPEIEAIGRFSEVLTPIPHIVWDLTLRNKGTTPIEVGELAFPMALNNFYEGFGRAERGGKSAWSDRVHIHQFVGGAASYVFAQRLTAEPPGLLVFPGANTSWEFTNHVPSSLASPYRWEGIPVVYVCSKAAMEREEWLGWHNGHTSFVLKPKEKRDFQTIFAPADRDRFDSLHQTLAAFRHPAMKLLPAAVAPADVGIAVEVGGSTPTQFSANKPADLETDSDEEGGFCFIRPKAAGPVRLAFKDTLGRTSYAHLLFTEPIQSLIEKRAEWIVEHQVFRDPGSVFDGAILVSDSRQGKLLNRPDDVGGILGIEGGLADALFLAEKNTIYPNRSQITVLDDLIDNFLLDDLQNPGDGTVGSAFADAHSVALNYAQPFAYALVFSLYHAMYRVARSYGEARRTPREYLSLSALTASAMLRYGTPRHARSVGLPGYGRIYELVEDMAHEGMDMDIDRLLPLVTGRAEDLLRREYPYSPPNMMDPGGFEEVYTAAKYLNDELQQERAMRCAYAARSLSPSWWWYGSDRSFLEDRSEPASGVAPDRGETVLGYTTAANSLLFLSTLERDYGQLPEAYMRLAFGGLLGVWALVNPDGSASMGYCPDSASRLYGFSTVTGDVGFALFHYLRVAGAYVLPSRQYGVFTFGCHFEVDEEAYTVRPWDGVGRLVVLRQVGAEFEAASCRIEEVKLDTRKRWASVKLMNTSDKTLWGELRVRGLWGNAFSVLGRRVEAVDGEIAISTELAPGGTGTVEIKVVG